MKRSILCLTIVCAGCVGPAAGTYPHSVRSDVYGPGIGQSATGEAMSLGSTFGNAGNYSNSQIQQRDAYGPGIHMDQYGRAVSWGW